METLLRKVFKARWIRCPSASSFRDQNRDRRGAASDGIRRRRMGSERCNRRAAIVFNSSASLSMRDHIVCTLVFPTRHSTDTATTTVRGYLLIETDISSSMENQFRACGNMAPTFDPFGRGLSSKTQGTCSDGFKLLQRRNRAQNEDRSREIEFGSAFSVLTVVESIYHVTMLGSHPCSVIAGLSKAGIRLDANSRQ